ncbi:T9SS type A sorting domain-containing protein [Fulvitalea axinellae]
MDNDGDLDAFLTGSVYKPTMNLYENDGSGNFTDVTNRMSDRSLEIAYHTVADVNNDGEKDILIQTRKFETLLFLNDNGNFSLKTDTDFHGAGHGCFLFADFDNDGDKDLYLLGRESAYTPRVAGHLYFNDGSGNFTESTQSFVGLYGKGTKAIDIDDDGDPDILSIGTEGNTGRIAIYINDGSGKFTLGNNDDYPFHPLRYTRMEITDLNGDNLPDIVSMGDVDWRSNSNAQWVYINQGGGKYTVSPENIFGLDGYEMVVGHDATDIDNDGDQDLILSTYGISYGISNGVRIYLNDGNGNLQPEENTQIIKVEGPVAAADVNGDGRQDLYTPGVNNYDVFTSQLYLNQGQLNFEKAWLGTPDEMSLANITAMDIDNDGDLDLLKSGLSHYSDPLAFIYRNVGDNDFELDDRNSIEPLSNGMTATGDIDNDGDVDFLLCGMSEEDGFLSHLYRNDGTGRFTKIETPQITGVANGAATFADTNGDGYLDLFITGNIGTRNTPTVQYFLNDGAGNFDPVPNFPFGNFGDNSAQAFADFDQDGDLDLMVCGHDESRIAKTELYFNDGNGHFSLKNDTPFPGLYGASIDITDIDQDGDQDLVLMGSQNDNTPFSAIFTNDGKARFSQSLTTLIPRALGEAVFIDFRKNGYPDLIIAGQDASGFGGTEIYENKRDGRFEKVTGINLPEFTLPSIATIDLNRDGKMDLMFSGLDFPDFKPKSETFYNTSKICPSAVNIDKITACDQYTWIDGITYTQSNNSATHTLQTLNGCDSLIRLDLTINNSTQTIDKITACDKYTWIDGITYTQSNNSATHTLQTLNGCDSLIRLDLTINNSTQTIDKITACDRYTWINGITYTQSNNSATHTLQTPNGCDSLIRLDLTINNSTQTIDKITACDKYTWIDGITYTQSNNSATHTLQTPNGCDSLIRLDLTINNSTETIDKITACDQYTWIDGITYTQSNNSATHTLQTLNGCDSLIRLDLTINNSTQTIDKITACDQYTWIDGITYTQSNNSATHTLQTPNGCDSLIRLDLTINNSTETIDKITTCDQYTWIDGITYTQSNNSAIHLLQTLNGCDSLIRLDLTIYNSTETIDKITACDKYTWIDGITYTQSNNSAIHLLQTLNGCDSLIRLDLTINNSTETIDKITACDQYTWIDGITYTQSNNSATHILQTVNGCDSLVRLDLSISPEFCETPLNIRDKLNAVKIYPNPTEGPLNIDFGKLKRPTLLLYDTQGKLLLMRKNISDRKVELDLNIKSGQYFMKIISEKNVKNWSVIVQ